MLLLHYISDASITTFRSELINDRVVWKAKIMANFAAENMGKIGCFQVRTGQKVF